MTTHSHQHVAPEADEIIADVIAIIAAARPMPMSATVKVNRDELLDLLEDAQARLPDELRAARWLLKERDDFLAEAEHERDEIIEQGRTQVARMIERQEVVKAADAKARSIVEEARAEARQLRHQVEDYCDQKLASFEIVLEKTQRTVQQGRERLLGTSSVDQLPAPPPPGPGDATDEFADHTDWG